MVGHKMQRAVEARASTEEVDAFHLGVVSAWLRGTCRARSDSYLAHAYPLHNDCRVGESEGGRPRAGSQVAKKMEKHARQASREKDTGK